MKLQELVGSCGISCGLCPRYQSKASSRCLGCGPDGHCSYCSIFRCSSSKNEYETCAECAEFPCDKFKGWSDIDSFVSHQKCQINLEQIKEGGVVEFLKMQSDRKVILEAMLEQYNPGKCMSLYCLASTLLSTESLQIFLEKAGVTAKGDAKEYKQLLQEIAEREQVELELRK